MGPAAGVPPQGHTRVHAQRQEEQDREGVEHAVDVWAAEVHAFRLEPEGPHMHAHAPTHTHVTISARAHIKAGVENYSHTHRVLWKDSVGAWMYCELATMVSSRMKKDRIQMEYRTN